MRYGDDGGEGAVDELLGVALVGAEPPGEGHEPRLVFGFEATRPAFAVGPEFFDDGHGVAGRSHPYNW